MTNAVTVADLQVEMSTASGVTLAIGGAPPVMLVYRVSWSDTESFLQARGFRESPEAGIDKWRQRARNGMVAAVADTLLDVSMMPGPPYELALHLERVLPAARPVVFRAHAEPDQLAKWWGPKGFSAPSVDVDLRVGGRYRIGMQPPDGVLFHLTGEFREVVPPARLVYTFRWEEPDPDDRETIVVLSLAELGDKTGLSVDQGAFATEARRTLHEQGWTETLDRLCDYLILSRGMTGK